MYEYDKIYPIFITVHIIKLLLLWYEQYNVFVIIASFVGCSNLVATVYNTCCCYVVRAHVLLSFARFFISLLIAALFIFYTLNIVDVDYVCNFQNWTGVQWPYYSNASIFLSIISFRFGLKKTELIWKMLNFLSLFFDMLRNYYVN